MPSRCPHFVNALISLWERRLLLKPQNYLKGDYSSIADISVGFLMLRYTIVTHRRRATGTAWADAGIESPNFLISSCPRAFSESQRHSPGHHPFPGSAIRMI
jgi:glutathione S-transferase